jgi:hypothetical protein
MMNVIDVYKISGFLQVLPMMNVIDVWKIGGFLQLLSISLMDKTNHDITEDILLHILDILKTNIAFM